MGLQFKRDTDYFGSKKAASSDWIGIILPFASQEQQQRGYGGYGNRRRVAIMGHTPSDKAKLADDKVIFAVVGLPTNAGSGAGNRKSKVKLSQGDVVFGRFIDQNTEQVPVILGVLGRTKEVVYGSGRYDIKPGWVGNTQALNLLGTQETNEDMGGCSPGATTTSKTEATNATKKVKASGLTPGIVGAVPPPPINATDVYRDLPDEELNKKIASAEKELNGLDPNSEEYNNKVNELHDLTDVKDKRYEEAKDKGELERLDNFVAREEGSSNDDIMADTKFDKYPGQTGYVPFGSPPPPKTLGNGKPNPKFTEWVDEEQILRNAALKEDSGFSIF